MSDLAGSVGGSGGVLGTAARQLLARRGHESDALRQLRSAAAAGTSTSPVNSSAPTAPTAPKPIDRSSPLFEASLEFEAIFIKQMLNAMRKTKLDSGLLDGGMAEEVFEDMLYDEYAQKMARTAGFGLAETLYRQLA